MKELVDAQKVVDEEEEEAYNKVASEHDAPELDENGEPIEENNLAEYDGTPWLLRPVIVLRVSKPSVFLQSLKRWKTYRGGRSQSQTSCNR